MEMTGDYAVELFVRDAPMDREAVRFHITKDNYALARDFRFTGDLILAAKQHPEVFAPFDELYGSMDDEDDEIEICPHCGTTMYE